MSEHPIESLMKTAMESIKAMVDVNTVVGDPVETADGSVIIPISKVSVGFAAGGGEYLAKKRDELKEEERLPFGGGSGAGVSVQPVGFLVVGNGQVRLLPVDGNPVVDRILDMAPQLIAQIQGWIRGDGPGKEKREANAKVNCEVVPHTTPGSV